MEITTTKQTNLETFKTDDGLEIIIDTKTGESFTSQRGYSRISNVAESTVRSRVNKTVKKTAQQSIVKTAQILTVSGLKTAQLLTEDYIAENLPKDNPEMATAFLKLGIRKYMHTVAGYDSEEAYIASSINEMKIAQAAMRQEIVNELRAGLAPIGSWDAKFSKWVGDLRGSITTLAKLQPTLNKIFSVIPAGYTTYQEFKDSHNYTFKRGAWPLVEKNLDSSKVIEKSPLNRVRYYDTQEIVDTINSLNLTGSIKINYGSTGRASKATVSL